VPGAVGVDSPGSLESIVFLKITRVVTLLLAALSLTMESAHVLELPQKLGYDAQMYAAVNGSLYKYFRSLASSISLARSSRRLCSCLP